MRRWQKTLLIALALLLLLTASAYWYLQKTLAALPLQNLQYQISSLSLRQLHLSSVSFSLDNPELEIQLNDINLSWQLFDPRLTKVQLGSGDIRLLQWPQTADNNTPTTADSLPADWQLPANLPEQININQLVLHLPCSEGDCSYQLSAALDNVAQQLQYQLSAADTNTPNTPRLTLSGDYTTVQQLPLLNLRLDLDNNTQLQLHQKLSGHNSIDVTGKLTIDIAPPSPWIIQQLQLWQAAVPPEALERFTAPVSVRSDWQFQLPGTSSLANIAAEASGHWQLDAELPSPLVLPGIGQLQGRVTAKLGLQHGELSQYQLNSHLTLLQPELSEDLLQQGIKADSVDITLTADGHTLPQLTALPLKLALSSKGATEVDITGDATFNLTPPFSAQIHNGKLGLLQQQLKPAPDVLLQKLALQTQFNAYWLADQWQLDLQNTTADFASLNTTDIQLLKGNITTKNSRFSGDTLFNNTTLQAAVGVNIGQLKQAQLKPLSWQWQAELSGNLRELSVAGQLTNSASLGVAHQLRYVNDALTVSWQLDDIFLLAGNPLAATLTSWPALLELNRGRLDASGEASLLPAINTTAELSLSGVSGIYDRSLFKDLASTIQLEYENGQIRIHAPETRLAEINHGLIAGPLLLNADYRTNMDAISAGILDIKQLQINAMGGQIQLQPTQLDLALAQQDVVLKLQQIALTNLLQQHPTTDLTGSGLISGTVPLRINRTGVTVNNGAIAAESPGGELQYRPAGAQNMAAGNAGMKVVLEALDDFHYSVLSSDVNYDTQGKLSLALKLQGSNPALENGRAINLNINLEEDLPALITSLQLSSKISDKIKQRVQQRIQQQSIKNTNGVKP